MGSVPRINPANIEPLKASALNRAADDIFEAKSATQTHLKNFEKAIADYKHTLVITSRQSSDDVVVAAESLLLFLKLSLNSNMLDQKDVTKVTDTVRYSLDLCSRSQATDLKVDPAPRDIAGELKNSRSQLETVLSQPGFEQWADVFKSFFLAVSKKAPVVKTIFFKDDATFDQYIKESEEEIKKIVEQEKARAAAVKVHSPVKTPVSASSAIPKKTAVSPPHFAPPPFAMPVAALPMAPVAAHAKLVDYNATLPKSAERVARIKENQDIALKRFAAGVRPSAGSEHYDWWLFPIPDSAAAPPALRSETTKAYIVDDADAKALLADPNWVNNYLQSFFMVVNDYLQPGTSSPSDARLKKIMLSIIYMYGEALKDPALTATADRIGEVLENVTGSLTFLGIASRTNFVQDAAKKLNSASEKVSEQKKDRYCKEVGVDNGNPRAQQDVPPDGNCFFFAAARQIIELVRLNRIPLPVPISRGLEATLGMKSKDIDFNGPLSKRDLGGVAPLVSLLEARLQHVLRKELAKSIHPSHESALVEEFEGKMDAKDPLPDIRRSIDGDGSHVGGDAALLLSLMFSPTPVVVKRDMHDVAGRLRPAYIQYRNGVKTYVTEAEYKKVDAIRVVRVPWRHYHSGPLQVT